MNTEKLLTATLAAEPEAVQRAAINVSQRMPGCPDATCMACQSNRDAITTLINVVRNAVAP